jgi:hypothetical protein
VAGWNASVGQLLVLPSQLSATSHIPTEARHSVVAGNFESVGHVGEMPLHVSAASQVPAAARHTVVAGTNAFVGHVAAVPLHISGGSQDPAEGRHTVAAGSGTHVPIAPATLHAWQSEVTPPPQGVLQQTPSTQLPDVHCDGAVQDVPLPPPEHCTVTVSVARIQLSPEVPLPLLLLAHAKIVVDDPQVLDAVNRKSHSTWPPTAVLADECVISGRPLAPAIVRVLAELPPDASISTPLLANIDDRLETFIAPSVRVPSVVMFSVY